MFIDPQHCRSMNVIMKPIATYVSGYKQGWHRGGGEVDAPVFAEKKGVRLSRCNTPIAHAHILTPERLSACAYSCFAKCIVKRHMHARS